MFRILPILLLTFLLTSCGSLFTAEHDISGVWIDEQGAIYCLDKDGTFGLPGQAAVSGLSWNLNHETLSLTTLDAPGGETGTRTLTLKSSSSRTLTFTDRDGHSETWNRSKVKVGRLEGRLFYRERIALPPQVTLDVQIYPLRGGSRPLAMILKPTSGTDLSFRIYYLPQMVTSDVRLSAAVLLGTEALFFTDGEQTVSLKSRPEVLLRQAKPGEYRLPALKVPARYRGRLAHPQDSEVELFLENNGVALIRGPEGLTLGTWLEKERNRVIEIARGELSPLRITRNSEGGDLAMLYGSRILFLSPAPDLPLPDTSLFLEGELRRVDGKPVFSECTSLRDLGVNVSSRGYSQLNALAGKGSATVILEGSLRNGLLDVRNVFQVHKGGVCSTDQYASAPLVGTYWRLRELHGTPVQSFPDQTEPHLIFADKDKATGSDGCNNFFMGWKRRGQELSFSEGGATLRLCPHGEEQAQNMRAMFPEVTSWNISGSKLELRTPKGVAAVFEAVDM